jgi:hypothetical protein
MVEMVADIGALLQDRAPGQLGIAGSDDPQRLAAGVHVNDGEREAHAVPVEPKPPLPRTVSLRLS